MPDDPIIQKPVADLAVFGLGPGGLAAALEAARSGKAVVAFTDRGKYIRSQPVSLHQSTVTFLRSFQDTSNSEDAEFFRRLEAERLWAQTKDIERYLHRKLLAMPNATIVTLEKGKDIPSFTTIAPGLHRVQLHDGNTYQFRNLLAADGARHKTADEVSKQFEINIKHEKTPIQPRHPYHAFVKLKRKPKASPTTQKLGTAQQRLQEASCLGWESTHMPYYNISINEKGTKLYFVGEIPESIHRAPPEEKASLLKFWAGRAIQEKYGIHPRDLEFQLSQKNPEKYKLQHTSFEMENRRVTEALYDLPGGGVFGQIGDARRTPVYLFGHGVNDAIEGGCLFSRSIQSNAAFSSERYKAAIQKMDDVVDENSKQREAKGKLTLLSTSQNMDNLFDLLITATKLVYDAYQEHDKACITLLVKAKQHINADKDILSVFDALEKTKAFLDTKKAYTPTFLANQSKQAVAFAERQLVKLQEELMLYLKRPSI